MAEGLRRIEDVTLLYGLSGMLLAVFFIVIIIFRPEGIMGQREISFERMAARIRFPRPRGPAGGRPAEP
jgi:hypothetical protein